MEYDEHAEEILSALGPEGLREEAARAGDEYVLLTNGDARKVRDVAESGLREAEELVPDEHGLEERKVDRYRAFGGGSRRSRRTGARRLHCGAALDWSRRFYCCDAHRYRAYRRRRAGLRQDAYPAGALRGRVALGEKTHAELLADLLTRRAA